MDHDEGGGDGDTGKESDGYSTEYSDAEDYFSTEEDTPEGQDPRARVLSVLELEDLFVKMAPDLSGLQLHVSWRPASI